MYGAALETISRAVFPRVSKIRGRIERDLRAARALHPLGAGGKPTLLFVGNSLLLWGVEREPFRRRLAPELDATLLPVESTQYADWYFGLKTIFAGGSRPAIVAAVFTPRQLLSPASNGENFARLLMSPGDLLAVKREGGLDNTAASEYFFANLSDWLGSRALIRNWLFFRIFPGLERAAQLFPPARAPLPPPAAVVSGALPRLRALDLLCRYYGARFVLVIPPTTSESGGASELQAAASAAGLTVLVPMPSDELTADEFMDGFHLNPRGAARFTPRVADSLLAAVGPIVPRGRSPRVASEADGAP